MPSSDKLAFFKYRGEGSDEAKEFCKCGFHRLAHDKGFTQKCVNKQTVVEQGKCEGFSPVGALALDQHYCGCRGWD